MTVIDIVNKSLNRAEKIWDLRGKELIRKSESVILAENLQTEIPGFSKLKGPEVGTFVAFVADMRNSTEHINSDKTFGCDVFGLQRVFYETSALLPVLAFHIYEKQGKVTEFLGDGLLGLFFCDEKGTDQTIRDAYSAAQESLNSLHVINEILFKRYELPEIKIGIGLSKSKALLSFVGLQDNYIQPKAFGDCVFKATKLSTGVNEINIDSNLRKDWPISVGGNLAFYKNGCIEGVGDVYNPYSLR